MKSSMMKDYTWRCDCNAEGSPGTFKVAREDSLKHLRSHRNKNPNWRVFIDEYDNEQGELSGKYWILEKNKRITKVD